MKYDAVTWFLTLFMSEEGLGTNLSETPVHFPDFQKTLDMKTAQLSQKRISVLVLDLITVQAVRQNQFLFKTRCSSVISKLAQHINIQIHAF